ncbi:hypothetical protein E2C01_049276 [Portunus trituberculatus]|uniref:Uncharacterized protein n=1 Tax=Portunus trituberculatus TaxID=210409 RepID=A0A5B7G8Z8_PORTR|nr:hypothetical protein [Portunus trituberculatus]
MDGEEGGRRGQWMDGRMEGVSQRERAGERGKVGYFIGKIEAILSQFRQAKGKQRWLRFKFNLYAKWWADVILGRVHGPPHLFRSPDPTLRLFPYYYNTSRRKRPRHASRRGRAAGRSDDPGQDAPRRQNNSATRPCERNPPRARPAARTKLCAAPSMLAETLRSPWQVHTSELCLFCN